MFAGGWLQLAFKQALKVAQALGMAKNGLERLGVAQQNCGCSSIERTKGHECDAGGDKALMLTESALAASFGGLSVLLYANQRVTSALSGLKC